MKFTLILNSHALSNFQKCETRYLYSDLVSLESNKPKSRMEVGTQVAKWLELYYYNRIRPRKSFNKALLNPVLWTQRFIEKVGCSKEDSIKYFRACFDYSTTYQNETWIPLHCEKGFTKVLYEDSDNFFLYEGRPDLHASNGNYELVSDHKVQFREYDIYPYNNQAYGYLWALKCKEFVYNYIKILGKSNEYRRIPITFDQRQIDNWQSNTIEWYFKIKHSIQKKSFLQSFQCTDVFGLCPFITLCETTTDQQKLFVIKANYKARKYRSW